VLTVYLEDIRDKELVLTGAADAEMLELLLERLEGERVTLEGPVNYRFRIVRAYDMIEVDGVVQTEVGLTCSRCLGQYSAPLNEAFSLTYAETLPRIEDESDEEEVELTADELGVVLLDGESFDLTEPLLENLLVALPLQPLCHEGCKGLCPHCGTDLNLASCQCEAPQFDTRFSALKNFKIGSSGDADES